ncbi:hypothetical protein [Maribacter sp. ACAM166]|uniref:hypothetical protein n=1 Tax=Maribacter sp. ACAM166 TaxID=2508996 RepID=UPI0010FEA660|nr:hypothetical protein [Maribacter sp. ACAM166]TLP80928.1 hypothetical protein ES765_05635 [Maribacter sp. ACAM166]
MATQTLQHSTYVYNEINVGKYIATKHYQLVGLDDPKNKLSTLVNISKDRKCAKSMPDYWFKIKQGKKYSEWLTGLFKTAIPLIYKGNLHKRKHLTLFKFSNNARTLTIKYFENYYTKDLTNLLPLFTD